MIVALTGATGYVGRFLAERLRREGAAIRAWRRPGSDPAGLPAGIEWIEGSLADRASMAALVEGAGCLVHAAYDHVPGRYRGGEGGDLDGFIQRNVGGSLALLAEARRCGVGRALFFSSRAVFGDRREEGAVGDDAAPSPSTHYGAAKAAVEAFVASWGLGDGWPVAALRPTGIYGMIRPAGRTKWFDLVGDLLQGRTVAPRAGTEVHGEDVAEAAWRLIAAPGEAIAGRMFNLSDMIVSTRMIAAEVNRIAGADAPLPEEGERPALVMACPGLERLGLRFGGEARFRETITAIVAAHRGG